MSHFASAIRALGFLLAFATTPASAADYAWIEAESLPKPPTGFKVAGWGNKHFLSGDTWLFAAIDGGELDKLPKDGITLAYPFELKSAGDHEVWGRVGYEFVRAPFRWRIDDGAWADFGPEQLTTDLMDIAEWAEIAWAKLGTAQLAAGKHTLEIRFERRERADKKGLERILTGLDCFCIHKGAFRPNGKHRPDEDWQQPADRAAAKQVFAVGAELSWQPRTVVSLKGSWQIARFDEQEIKDRDQPIRALPANHGELFWKAVAVPGNRDETRRDMLYCHRFLYRTRVKVPVDLAGRSFTLRFPSTALIASVFVNGKLCGESTTPCVAWEADATSAIVPGQENEVVVAMKDCYYALAQTGDGKSVRYLFNYPHNRFYADGGLSTTRFADFPVLLQVQGAGIFETPTLTVTGPVSVADVFAKPSVSKKQLGLEITLHNSGAAPLKVTIRNEIVPLGKGPAEKTFTERAVTVAAGKDEVVDLTERWENPRLWWPDDPRLYQVVTRVAVNGKISDLKHTTFGFREWQWQGKHFTLNGIPWHFRADLLHNGKITDPKKAAEDWKKSGINTVRYWGYRPWFGESQEETLDYYDRIGMPIRRTGTFDGEAASYQMVEQKDGKTVPRKALFDNWIRQLEAWVKAERNHPSIFVWSIENEVTYINIKNFGLLEVCEPEIKRAAAAVMKLDPTRPAMVDGGDALRDKSLPIYGNHYNEGHFRMYPDEAYTMKWAFSRHKTDQGYPWPIGDDKPLFLGETFFSNGFPPAGFAAVQGEAAFLGRAAAAPGERLFARMLAEGYRWHGIAGFHFWMSGDSPDNEHYKAFQPICVMCREWNSTFGKGEKVSRTLKVFNDTRYDDPIEAQWAVVVKTDQTEGYFVAKGKKILNLKPGTAEEFTIDFTSELRGSAYLFLRAKVKDEIVFEDRKACRFIDSFRPPLPEAIKTEITLFDPKGATKAWLEKRGYSVREVAKLADVPANFKLLIVGPDALTAREATDPRWLAWAAAGKRVLVLDQEHPLHFQAIPADLETTTHSGRIAFPENVDHPAFQGLAAADFFTWPGEEHLVYRHCYKKATRGARSLLQCDEELSCTALAECAVGDGVLLLAQVSTQAGLDKNAVLRRLFDNLVDYAATYRPVAKTTVSVFPTGDLRAKLLDSIGLKHTPSPDVVAALSDAKAEIVVADASPANLAALKRADDKLQAFAKRGGSLMLWGLTPAGLADFNDIVKVRHAIRPFGMERVSLPGVRDPLTAGLTLRDVTLEGTEKINPWAADRYPSKETFTHIVDLEDIAPFVRPGTQAHAWGQMTNGLTSADNWKFILYHNLNNEGAKPRWTGELPYPSDIVGFSVVLNTHYNLVKKLRLTFDDKETVDLDMKPGNELKQDFNLKGFPCKKIAIEPIAWDDTGKAPVLGIDNIWLRVRRDDDYQKRVVPLLNMGALVKYRLGSGSIILNQVNVLPSEANPVNGPKRQNLVATLLRNLGATFAGERTLVAGANLKYSPIPLGEKCTQYLTTDKGWFGAGPDLAHFPVGEQKLASVTYDIRDFRTSPLPACIMLAGPGVKGNMPAKVTGIPVNRKADMLFFLHTFNKTRDWQPPHDKRDQPPPAVFRYTVHYKDGSKADVPVLLNRGVGHWLSPQPAGLSQAAVGWAAPLPGNAATQAVVYQMPWTNPHPDREIAAVDVSEDADQGSSYGVPVVLAITAATEEK